MAGETATIKQSHGFTSPLSIMKERNPDMYDTNMPRMYPIQRHIYIHSVAKRDFDVKHVYFRGALKGCHAGERYVTCYAVPDPPQQISVDAERGGKRVEVEPTDDAGWRVAIDILNPNNPTNDPYFKLDAKSAAFYSIGQNVDLIKQGVFPSLNQVPTEQELLKAEAVRDATWQALIDEAFQEQASNPQNLRNWLRAHPDVYDAVAAFGIEADFITKKAVVKQECPNCGSSIKAGIAFHMYEGGLCVLDWRRAYEAGRVKKEDVPPGKRWQGFGKVEPV
jgi:hypothetical protein